MTHGATTTQIAERSPRGKPTSTPPPGTRFGRWTVRSLVPEYRQTKDRVRPYVFCFCDCGSTAWVNVRNLQSGSSKSCGCLHSERASEANATHQQTGQRLHRIWKQMHQRCYNPKCRSYRWYGAKGVMICNGWLDSFEAFRDWALRNGYFDKAEIDRKNSNGNYSPRNCQWVTKQENLINRQNLLPVHLEKAVQELAIKEGVTTVTIIRQAVGSYMSSPSLRRKRVKAR